MNDPLAISRNLLSPGPSYLVSAFQADHREERLEEIANLFGLRAALENSGTASVADEWDAAESYSDRWLRLLRRAVTRVSVPTVRAELEAIVQALEDYAGKTNAAGTFWDQAATHLTTPSITAGTLRNRRWPTIRMRLAEELGRFAPATPPEDVLPHEPLTPGLFRDADFSMLLDKLNGDFTGLAVLVDEPGVGKSEFAVAYAQWARTSYEGKARYDRVFWLRADDPLILEQDYLALGRILDPSGDYDDPSDVLAVMGRSDRWLLIFDDVREPAVLLRYLPRRAAGHVICTADIDVQHGLSTVDRSPGAPPALKQLRDRACEPWQKYFGVPLSDPDEIRFPSHVRSIDVQRLLNFRGIHCDEPESEGLLSHLGRSRLALTVASTWLRLYGKHERPIAEFLDALHTARTVLESKALSSVDIRRDGLTASYALLQHAERTGRNQFDGLDAANDDDSAFVLLQRLEAFAPHAIPIQAVRKHEEDERLQRLEALGLIARHWYFDQECFEIHDEIRQAMTLLMTNDDQRRNALAVAAVTVLDLSQIDLLRPKQPMNQILLPHVVSLASRLVSDEPQDGASLVLPLTSVELTARAAATYWLANSPRQGAEQIRVLRQVLRKESRLAQIIAKDLRAGHESGWDVELSEHTSELRERQDLLSPAQRLLKLIVMLRRVGFRSGAYKLCTYVEPLFDDALTFESNYDAGPNLRGDRARLAFEMALCLRENADLEKTQEQLEKARTNLDEPADIAQCDAMLAVGAQDHGNLRAAMPLLQMSLKRRRSILEQINVTIGVEGETDELSRAKARAWEELARGYFVLTRGMLYGGLPIAMTTAARIAVDCWTASETVPRINRATARSNLALALALQRAPEAPRLAEVAFEEADVTFGPKHHDSALVQMNRAYVMALSDDSASAAEIADESFRIIIRHWPRRHPLVLGSRLLAASCKAEAGQASNALDHLFVLLDDAGLAGVLRRETEPRALVEPVDLPTTRAAAWIAIGNLLLDASTHVLIDSDTDLELVASKHARAPECLDAAERCFLAARGLLDRHPEHRIVIDLGERSNNRFDEYVADDSLQADLGLLEVQLRRGKADVGLALEVVERARQKAEADRSQAASLRGDASMVATTSGDGFDVRSDRKWSITELHALAKLARAVTSKDLREQRSRLTDEFSTSPLASVFWSSLLVPNGTGEDPVYVFNARDRIHFALAWQNLLFDDHRSAVGAASTNGSAHFATIAAWIEDDLLSLRGALGDEHHPQIALRYSALAQFPGTKGKNYRRARNLREVERSRVLLLDAVIGDVREKLRAEAEVARSPSGITQGT